MQRRLHSSAVAYLVMGFVLGLVASGRADSRPHIILVMADDQGWGDMAYNGHPRLQTPHFDAAAASSLCFDRFYAAAPVCSPTRASVLTGRHPNRTSVFKWGHPIRPQEITVAELLQRAGYATAHFGKWHLGSVRNASPAHPGRNGFEHWLSAPNFFDNNPILSAQGQAIPMSGESSRLSVDAATDWMRKQLKREPEQPMLVVIWFGSPHSPHRAAAEDRALYEGLPERLQNFYGEITGMDAAFGKLQNALAQLNIRDDTLLWYCSDNGALPRVGSSGGYRGHKGQVYEGGLLVPAFLQWPRRIAAGRVCDAPCTTSDIMPTLLELLNLELPERPVDGLSLVPVIQGASWQRPAGIGFWNYPASGISTPSAQWMSELLEAQTEGRDLPPHASSLQAAELPDPPYPVNAFPGHAAWLQWPWKLHRLENDGEVTFRLYQLSVDPIEQNDVLAQNPNIRDSLANSLAKWQESVIGSLNGNDYEQN